MSAMGHEQTSHHLRVMSVIPLKADIHQRGFARPLSANSRHCRTLDDEVSKAETELASARHKLEND
jgi:hypothetical protein